MAPLNELRLRKYLSLSCLEGMAKCCLKDLEVLMEVRYSGWDSSSCVSDCLVDGESEGFVIGAFYKDLW